MTDPLKIYMYSEKLFNLAISAKIFGTCTQHRQKAIDYAQKIETEFLHVVGDH